MKKQLTILSIFLFSMVFIACSPSEKYDSIEHIESLSITKTDNYDLPLDEFDIEVTDNIRLNQIKSFINSSEKHSKNSNITYDDYLVDISYDNTSDRFIFFFPEDNDDENAFFYKLGEEDNIYSISEVYVSELDKLFFNFNRLDQVKDMTFSTEDNYNENNEAEFITIDDDKKVSALKMILENSSLDYNVKVSNCENYILQVQFLDEELEVEPIVLCIPNNNESINFHYLSNDNLKYKINEDLSSTIKSILFER